jgi:hypothetical protein
VMRLLGAEAPNNRAFQQVSTPPGFARRLVSISAM